MAQALPSSSCQCVRPCGKSAVKKLWHLHYALDGKFYNIYEDTTKYTDNVFRYSKTGEDGVY